MRTERRPNGSTPHPAVSFRFPAEVRDKLKALAEKNEKNDTQMMIALINGSYARSNI